MHPLYLAVYNTIPKPKSQYEVCAKAHNRHQISVDKFNKIGKILAIPCMADYEDAKT